MTEPLVSVVVVTHNTGPHLPETLESALRQSHPGREIIVVDDGSTDDTPARIEPYRTRITYIRQSHLGLHAGRHAALRRAAGDYVAFLDADDLWLPDKLEVQLGIAARHPETGLIACNGVQFAGADILTRSLLFGPLAEELGSSPHGEITGDYHRAFIRGNVIACPAQTLIPRHVVDRVGPLVAGGAQDYDYYLRIAMRYPVTLHRHTLVRWRYRPDSLSGPRDRRGFVWALNDLPALRRHRARCAGEDRRLVSRRIADVVTETAREAYHCGVRGERAYATSVLVDLIRASRQAARPMAYLAALWMPAALLRSATHCLKALRRLGR